MAECQVCGLDGSSVTLKQVDVPSENPSSTKMEKATVCNYCAPRFLGIADPPVTPPTAQ